jgi:hypothetical protein
MQAMARSSSLLRALPSALALPVVAWTQSTPPVPSEYQRFFVQYGDRRSLFEKALNSVGLTSLDVGRSYALIAGVSRYPNLGLVPRPCRH